MYGEVREELIQALLSRYADYNDLMNLVYLLYSRVDESEDEKKEYDIYRQNLIDKLLQNGTDYNYLIDLVELIKNNS